ncbi:MAG: hypothetical protein QOD24_2067 [Solirubrobacteraceae bacterium]|nr:hypothetical protein [Solirubrobacteraceae bacterium]
MCSREIAAELKDLLRLAGRDPEALEGRLPALSALHRVTAAGALDEPARVHFILHHLIPEYLGRLPDGRDCRAIRELLTWEDADGDLQSLTTRYHKAAAHLVHAASDFGRRQEPRLLLECARRFIGLDHEDRLGAPQAPSPAHSVPATDVAPVVRLPIEDPRGGIVRVHPNLDYHLLFDYMARADEIVIANTWIPGLDILADALVDALARGTSVSILMLHPESQIAQLRSHALHDGTAEGFRQDRVGPGVRHCLDVLAAVASMVEEAQRANLRVRLYNSLPSISVYRMDDRAFISFFLHGQLVVRSVQIEVLGENSVMGRLAAHEIETLWDIGRELDDITPWPGETQRAPRRVRKIEATPRVTQPPAAATG